jgi:hypothetical protein
VFGVGGFEDLVFEGFQGISEAFEGGEVAVDDGVE